MEEYNIALEKLKAVGKRNRDKVIFPNTIVRSEDKVS